MSLLGMIGKGLGKAAGSAFGLYQSNYANQKEDWNAKRQQQRQMELNQQGHDLQMDMWNKTNYGAQIGHMKEAGLNPALMYGMGGGGGATTGSQGGGSAAKGMAQKQMGIEGLMAASQIGLNDSLGVKAKEEGELAKAKGDEIRGETPESKARIGKLNGEIENLKKQGKYIEASELNKIQDTELKKFEAEIKRIDANWLKKNNLSTMSIKELKLLNDVTNGGLDSLMEMIGNKVQEGVEFVNDPIGKTKEYGQKGYETVKGVIHSAFEALKR